ncbi:hypothetical protein [Amycolatopsis sp. CA-230715]|uniref:hypothetical protein n=1 Tax=Amycolatopsis sp. CA-230715 TaxID=2745196 RepID=UPI001C010355|nr:hypothetical protein [Amycolatopsis sp. CA-230715]QWF77737.1 hypothetical protein HUW46_01129 [Amycolatopsis sp. CA-230715]
MIALWLLPPLVVAIALPLAHRLAAYVPPRHEAPAARTRVVLDEAYGYEHVEPLTRSDLVALL